MSKLTILNFCISKKTALILGGLGTLAAAYGIYRFIQSRHQPDEYFSTLKWQGGSSQRRILVLGLEAAGKSRLLQCFQQNSYPGNILPIPEPSIGYNIHSVGIGGVDYHFWEGRGTSEQSMQYLGIPSSVDMYIWVVDSSNPASFAKSRAAMHKFLDMCDRMTLSESKDCLSMVGAPLVIVAAQQDVEGSVSAADVLYEMDVDAIQHKHKVYIVGTQLPDVGQRKGLWRLYELVAYAEQKRYTPCIPAPSESDVD
ncbi:uncharacterized protein LOC123546548 [Mercenaria mercenaria]|uniref:uncharacterized protein LOC123546548 n=1 Tax=Mercenaria mercenaria TaxID=6596 RepID=UPI001E1D4ED0|nr:uncharacterized protein LOC123546548 [Mercenaria mercenaria]